MNDAARQIAADLAALGVRTGDVLLVHSSQKSLGPAAGGPQIVIDGLRLALGEQGTLLMPALSYATVGPRQTTFDVVKTPSCVGAVPEFFRTLPGVTRSVHPTHSACGEGPRAAELLGRHQLDTTPCGEHSPFRLLRDAGGKILMLGCGLRPNTSMHGVEELAMPPYLLGEPVDYRVILADGGRAVMNVRRHNFGGTGGTGYRQRYDRALPLLDASALRAGRVLAARAYLIDAAALWRVALEALRADPFYLVEPAQ